MGSKYGLHLCAHFLITTRRWPLNATEVTGPQVTNPSVQCNVGVSPKPSLLHAPSLQLKFEHEQITLYGTFHIH